MINIKNCRDFMKLLSIRTKEGTIVPFRLNEPQERCYEAIAEQFRNGRPVRVIILKARQEGFSTLTEAIMTWLTSTAENTDALVIAHKEDATANLFRMTKLYYETMPDEIKPMRAASNAQELVFDRPSGAPADIGRGLRSRVRCATAGGQGVGRSDTLRGVHMSEFAFWPGKKMETFTGIMQAVPSLPGTIVVIESTANGYDEFQKLWDDSVKAWERGERDGFMPLFFPWFEMKSYRKIPEPGFRRTEEEEKLAETFKLDDEQLSWRRWCIKNNCGGDVEIFHQEFPSTPDEAFLSTGRCVFDKTAIVMRRKQAEEIPVERGEFGYDFNDLREQGKKFENIHFREGKLLRILKRPEKGVPYVIGADTAGTGSDHFIAQVLDNRSGVQVAVLDMEENEMAFTRQLYCLGKWYNNALIGIETNYSTYPQMEMQRLGYQNFYVRESVDTFTGAVKKSFGYETTSRTRPLMIDKLKTWARESIETIGDYDTLGEMLTFVYNENYRPEADEGSHDDHVMALAIAHMIRGQQRTEVDRSGQNAVEWSKSMWEDYDNAGPELKKYLIGKWGTPKERK